MNACFNERHNNYEKLLQEKDEAMRLIEQQFNTLFLHFTELQKENSIMKKKTNPFLHSLKDYFDLQRTRKTAIKRDIKVLFSNVNEIICAIGLQIEKVQIKKSNNEVANAEFDFQIEKSYDNDITSVEHCLYVKDKNSISDRTYNNLRKELKLQNRIVPLSRIKKLRKEINASIQTNFIADGVFLDIKQTIISRISFYYEKSFFDNRIIHIKLSADGTNIGKTIKMINLTFSLINEGVKATTASGQYTLGLIEIENEEYDSLKPWFVEIVKQLQELKDQKLIINENEFYLEFYFAADLKSLANVLGLKQASSSYPCIWCEIPKDSLHLLLPESSITDTSKLARSEDERKRIISNNKNISDKGYKNESLLGELVPFHRCVVDTLHMKLRIILNVLLEQLIIDLIILDNFRINQKLDEQKHKNIFSYITFLKSIKINVKFKPFAKQGKTHLHRELNGTEISRFLASVDLCKIYPIILNENDNDELSEFIANQINKRDKLQALFKDFYEIYIGVIKNELNSFSVKDLTSKWLELFLDTFHSSKVTPYIHIFCAHLHEFQYLYGNVNLFNQQGLEKLNDLTTIDYFRSTNKSEKSLIQILKKRTRIASYEMKK